MNRSKRIVSMALESIGQQNRVSTDHNKTRISKPLTSETRIALNETAKHSSKDNDSSPKINNAITSDIMQTVKDNTNQTKIPILSESTIDFDSFNTPNGDDLLRALEQPVLLVLESKFFNVLFRYESYY